MQDALVLELGQGIASSYAGKLLLTAGATVVKLEIESAVWRIPERWEDPAAKAYVESLDSWLNDGKESVAFRSPEELAQGIRTTAGEANVLIEDMTEDERRQAGVNYAEPPCTWISTTPFGVGQVRQGSDLTAASMSGAIWAIGLPERVPLNIPHWQTAVQGGVIAATLAAAAVGDDGEPRWLDVAWTEVISAYATTNATLFVWEREGHRAAKSGGAYPYTILPCKDGLVCVTARSNSEWRRIIDAVGNPEWSKNERYRDVRKIAEEYPDEVDNLLSATLQQYTRNELLNSAIEHRCTIAPVRTFNDLVADDELVSRGVISPDLAGGWTPSLPWFHRARPSTKCAVGDASEDTLHRLGLTRRHGT